MTAQEQYFDQLISLSTSVLKLPYLQVKEKYADYPLCLMEYIDKGNSQQCIEIGLDTEKASLTCYFNEAGNCDSSYLLFDKEEAADNMIDFLIDNSNYCFKLCRWDLPDSFMKVSKQENDVFLMFYPKR